MNKAATRTSTLPPTLPSERISHGLPAFLIILAGLMLLVGLFGLLVVGNYHDSPENVTTGWLLLWGGLGSALSLWVASDIVSSLRRIAGKLG